MNISFVVPAVPVAQPRARAVMRNGHAGVYNPTTIKNADGSSKPHPIAAFKASARHEAAKAYSGPPLRGALTVKLLFVFPRPQNMIWKKKPMPRVPHVRSKNDCDNLAKSLLDALNELTFADDGQVWQLDCTKVYANGTEQAHVEVHITEINGLDEKGLFGDEPA